MAVLEITSIDHLDQVLHHDVAVVTFGATWCAPCRDFLTVLKGLAVVYPKVVFAKVDIDKVPCMGIRQVPTTKVFVREEHVKTYVGSSVRDDVVSLLDKVEDPS